MCKENQHHDHGIGLFSKNHSCIERELENKNIHIEDDENLIEKKKQYEEDASFTNLLELGNAYSFQLRYQEALVIYNQCIDIEPSYIARRKRAITYLKLLMLDEAYQEFLWCKEHTTDVLDVTYRLGLVKYYQGEYMLALKHFKECFSLSLDNPDMYVSCLYWYYLALVKLGLPLDEFKAYRKQYKNNFYTHPGYDLFIRFVSKEMDIDEFNYEADTFSFLQQTCCYYGMYVYYAKDNKKKSEEYLISTLSYRDYFGGFAYLAAYCDKKRTKN